MRLMTFLQLMKAGDAACLSNRPLEKDFLFRAEHSKAMNHAMLQRCMSCIAPNFHGSTKMKFHKGTSSKISEILPIFYMIANILCARCGQ